MTTIDSIDLYLKEGSSDKEYHAQIYEVPGGHIVNFQYGRRGTALQTGTKTTSPVDLASARKIYDKLVKEKTGKGYTLDTSGKIFAGTQAITGKELSGMRPQLLNPITESEALALLADDDYFLQQKIDGIRLMIEVDGNGKVTGSNKKGLVVAVPNDLVEMLSKMPTVKLDGELIGSSYHVFDLLQNYAGPIETEGYTVRFNHLCNLVATTTGFSNGLMHVVPTCGTTETKLILFDKLRKEGQEGVVFKRKSAPYKPGRPSSGGDQLKYKFYETASVQVVKVNDQRSVEVAVLNDIVGTGTGRWRSVGNVTIPLNHPVPAAGIVVEVRYLYAYPNGCLYQPTYLGVRSDTDLEECVESQLKFKAS